MPDDAEPHDEAADDLPTQDQESPALGVLDEDLLDPAEPNEPA